MSFASPKCDSTLSIGWLSFGRLLAVDGRYVGSCYAVYVAAVGLLSGSHQDGLFFSRRLHRFRELVPCMVICWSIPDLGVVRSIVMRGAINEHGFVTG